MQPLENADISISLPPIVKIDEDFDFDITITNISTEAITLNSINIGESFVDGILIGDSEPIFELRQRFDMLGIPMEMFVFNEMILVGESLIIQFDAEATSVGDFTGQMFLCVDDTTNCELYLLRTVVEE